MINVWIGTRGLEHVHQNETVFPELLGSTPMLRTLQLESECNVVRERWQGNYSMGGEDTESC
jgi:hypothetical protein